MLIRLEATRNTRTYSFPMGCLTSLTLRAFNKCHSGFNYNINQCQFILYLHVLNSGLCSFLFFSPIGAFWICIWLIFSSTLQCLLEKLALLIGLNDSLPMHSFSEYDWSYNPLDKRVSCNYSIIFRNRGRLMASLFINVLYSSILAGDSDSECFLNPWQFLI